VAKDSVGVDVTNDIADDVAVDVAIVGAGFCGTMLAVHLAGEPSIRTALFERDEFARGLAYSTTNPRHLLNLTTAKMSPFPDKPADFVEWLESASPTAYVPRARYAGYLRSVLDGALHTAPQIRTFRESVVALTPESDGFVVKTDRRSVRARCAVLAVGNSTPGADFIPEELRHDPQYAGDPWAVPFDELSGDVLVIGNGLTAVDVLVELQHRAYEGRIVVLSRHGRVPQTHKTYGAAVDVPLERRTPLTMLRSVRQAVAAVERDGGDWRAVVDGIRPLTQAIWQTWPLAEQQRFLRHLRIFWETSRRRVPPEVAAAVNRLASSGRFERIAGRIETIAKRPDGRFRVRVARAGETTSRDVNWIVNCTGPQSDVAKIDDALMRSLRERGSIRPHATRIGIDATPDGRVIDARGVAQSNLLALGTLLRGVLYETISVPELSIQVKELAQKLIASMAAPVG
jgi:uncharacterized NAD(P)/FAD-binding protein YdhS